MTEQVNIERKRPAESERQARVMSFVNIPMRVLLRLPFKNPINQGVMLLSYRGRKSGKAYLQPVSYVQQGDTLLTPGGGNWKWNMLDGKAIKIYLRGKKVSARPEMITNVDEIEQLLVVMRAANPSVNSFIRLPTGPDGKFERGSLETAVRYGFRIVRWHLEEQPSRV